MNKPENDAEAEVALLTLGSTLKWARARDLSSNIGGFETFVEHVETHLSAVDTGMYSVFVMEAPEGGWCCHWTYVPPRGTETPPEDPARIYFKCRSLAAGKAACERHHATGEWE